MRLLLLMALLSASRTFGQVSNFSVVKITIDEEQQAVKMVDSLNKKLVDLHNLDTVEATINHELRKPGRYIVSIIRERISIEEAKYIPYTMGDPKPHAEAQENGKETTLITPTTDNGNGKSDSLKGTLIGFKDLALYMSSLNAKSLANSYYLECNSCDSTFQKPMPVILKANNSHSLSLYIAGLGGEGMNNYALLNKENDTVVSYFNIRKLTDQDESLLRWLGRLIYVEEKDKKELNRGNLAEQMMPFVQMEYGNMPKSTLVAWIVKEKIITK